MKLYIKNIVKVLVIVVIILLPIADVSASLLDEKRNELDSINSDIDRYQEKINQTKDQINSLKLQINILDNRINQARLEIEQTEIKIDKTNIEIYEVRDKIKQKKEEIEKQKQVAGEAIKYMYEEGETPFVVTLFSSSTFSQILDRNEYLSTVERRVQRAIETIEIKKRELQEKNQELKNKNIELNSLKKEHQNRLSNLDTQTLVKNKLLATTKGEERVYEKKLSDLNKRQMSISGWLNERVYQSGSTNTNWDGNCISGCRPGLVDGWCHPQCVAYVVWRVGVSYGNGCDWTRAPNAWRYIGGRRPQAGDVMSWPSYFMGTGIYGHVAYIESVNGNNITISESNWACPCCYSRRVLNLNNYHGAYFLDF